MRGRSPGAALALLMLVPLLAGCLGNGADPNPSDADGAVAAPTLPPGTGIDVSLLTRDQFGFLPEQTAYVTSTLDGIQLFVEIWLPDGEGPWPTIIENSPYYGATGFNGDFRDGESHRLASTYVPKGYAVVAAHVRGTGNSEGCMNMMGPKEQADTYDLVQWVANQSWSDGKVGMAGFSYVGTTPNEALIMAPPNLVTVAAGAGVTNQWRNTFQNGVPYQGRHYPLTYEVISGAPPPTDVMRGPDWLLNVAGAACEQEEAVMAMSPGTYEKGVYTEYWDERNLTKGAANAKASILYYQGFADRAVNPMEAVHWFNALDVPKKGVFHQGTHQNPQRDDWATIHHAWFDHWLKGIDNGIMDTPQVEIITNDDRVRVDTHFPPRDADTMRLYLATDTLQPDPPQEASQTYTQDSAQNAFPLIGFGDGQPYRNSIEYLSPPMTNDTYLSGPVRFHLVGSVDAENTYWLSDLYDVAPDGAREWLAEGWMNAHLHEGWDKSSPLTPGETYAFDFLFEPREWILKEGHQLRLRITGNDARVFPVDQPVTQNTVYYGPDGSYLDVPVIPEPELYPLLDDPYGTA